MALLVVYGVYMALTSFLGLRKTRKIQKKIRQRQKEVIAQSDAAKKLLDDLH